MDASTLGASIWLTFALVLARCSGVLLAVPSWDARSIPWSWRTVLALGLAILLTPACLAPRAPAAADLPTPPDARTVGERLPATWLPPRRLAELSMIGAELLTGLVLGVGVLLLLWGIQMAGQLVSQMAGLPATQESGSGEPVSAVARLLDLFALALFLVTGSHRTVIRTLLDSFQTFPLGRCCLSHVQLDAALRLLTHSFEFGLRVVLPVVSVMLVSSVLAGMLGRVMPQFNVLLLSSGWNSLLLLAALGGGVGAIAWALQSEPLWPVLDLLRSDTAGAAAQDMAPM